MKRKSMLILISLGSFLLLAGCAGKVAQLNQGADQVKVGDKRPKQCQQLGEITAKQSGRYLSAKSLEKGAMNQLRNAAHEKNANYVHIDENYTTFFQPGFGDHSASSVTVKGQAYHCP